MEELKDKLAELQVRVYRFVAENPALSLAIAFFVGVAVCAVGC